MWLTLIVVTVVEVTCSKFIVSATSAVKSCGQDKVCVTYELCHEGIMVDGHFYPDRSRTLQDEQNCHYMEKCCSANETLSEPILTPELTNPSLDSVQCGKRFDLWYHLRPMGYKQHEIKFAEFPWLVAIYGAQGYVCSGALISPLAVLTSAHCVLNETVEHLRLVAGEWDAAVELEPLLHQTRPISELLIHPNYTQTPAAHNLAVLLVDKKNPFELAPHIQLICLPPPQMIYNFSQCYVAGWQRKDFGNAEILPKRATLYALPRDQCRAKLRLAILGRRYSLNNDSLICAGGDKDDFVCGNEAGMSGVPLMCPLSGCMDCFVLAGVLARAGRCDGPQLLGIYTNVKFYRQWIDQKLRERDLDIRQYMV